MYANTQYIPFTTAHTYTHVYTFVLRCSMRTSKLTIRATTTLYKHFDITIFMRVCLSENARETNHALRTYSHSDVNPEIHRVFDRYEENDDNE